MDKKNIFPMFYDEPLTDLNFSNWKLLPPMFRCFIGITRFERKIGFFFTMIQSLLLQLSPQLDFTLVFQIWVKKMSLQVPPGGLGASQIQQIRRCSTSCSPEILTWTGVLVCVSRMLATRSRPRASVSFDPADHRPSAGRMRSHDSIRPLPKSHVTRCWMISRFLWWLHHLSGNFVGWLNRL